MAINFLQDVSLNNTQLTNFKVQNITGTLPSSLSGEGQLIYKSDKTIRDHAVSSTPNEFNDLVQLGREVERLYEVLKK